MSPWAAEWRCSLAPWPRGHQCQQTGCPSAQDGGEGAGREAEVALLRVLTSRAPGQLGLASAHQRSAVLVLAVT